MKKLLFFLAPLLLLTGCIKTVQKNVPYAENSANAEVKVQEKNTTAIDKKTIFEWPFTYNENISKLEIPITDECEMKYTQDNISFSYPCGWKINSDKKSKYLIDISYYDDTPPGNGINVSLPAESFVEFEDVHKDQINGKLALGMSVREKQVIINDTTYPIKEYREHQGCTFLLKIEGNYIKFGSETCPEPNELSSVYIILRSIKF